MDKYHENKNSMYKAVDQFFIDKKPTAPVIPALTKKVTAFHGIVIDIDAKNGELITETKGGQADAKTNSQESLFDLLFRITAHLRSIAAEKNNSSLLQLASVSNSKIASMRDTEQLNYAEQISDNADANAAALADFGVDDAMLKDFNSRIDDFRAKLGTREAASGVHSAVRESLFKLFVKADSALDDLDNTMVAYKTTDPDFYNQYMAIRPIRSVGLRHKNQRPVTPPQAAGTK